MIDKLAKRNVIHKNKANNLKSQLARVKRAGLTCITSVSLYLFISNPVYYGITFFVRSGGCILPISRNIRPFFAAGCFCISYLLLWVRGDIQISGQQCFCSWLSSRGCTILGPALRVYFVMAAPELAAGIPVVPVLLKASRSSNSSLLRGGDGTNLLFAGLGCEYQLLVGCKIVYTGNIFHFHRLG